MTLGQAAAMWGTRDAAAQNMGGLAMRLVVQQQEQAAYKGTKQGGCLPRL